MRARLFGAAFALAALSACDATAPRVVPVALYLTEAPGSPVLTTPPEGGEPVTVTAATVRISRAYLMPGQSEDGPGFTITAEPQDYDLFALADGATALLGSDAIPEGRYAQLRLVVESADVMLSDGSTHTLVVPSGMESGIKVTFPGAITVGGAATDITVAFDVSANFRLAPPGGPHKVLFTPLLVGSVTEG